MRTYLVNLYKDGEMSEARITCHEEDLSEFINDFRYDGFEVGNVIELV